MRTKLIEARIRKNPELFFKAYSVKYRMLHGHERVHDVKGYDRENSTKYRIGRIRPNSVKHRIGAAVAGVQNKQFANCMHSVKFSQIDSAEFGKTRNWRSHGRSSKTTVHKLQSLRKSS